MSFRTCFGIYKSKCSVDTETSSAWQYFLDSPVIIGFTSCNQPSSQTVLYPPVIKDFKLVDGSVNSDTVYDALPAKKIKYEKNYTVVVSFSDLDLNTTELHLSLDNFNRDDVTFNINTKYTD